MGESITKTIKRVAGATLLVSAFSIFSGLIANSFRPTAAQDGTVQINAAVGTGDVSITIDNSDPCGNFDETNMTLTLNAIAGGVASDCIAVSASTSNPFGYTLTIEGPTAGVLAGDNFQNIAATSGTMENPVVFANSATEGNWGFAIPSGQIQGFDWGFDASYSVMDGTTATNTALFAAVPTVATPFSTTSVQNVTPDEYHIFFAVSTGMVMPTGTYSGTVTISGVANTVAPPTVTNISPNTGPLEGGTLVTITGTSFMLDGSPIVESVTIGGAPCTPINVTSDTTLTCTTTAGSVGGAADVVVTTSGGAETLAGGFEYTTMLLMQNITAANCPTTLTMAVDARDNRTYWVQRRGNQCWMKTNLAYMGGGDNAFGDVMPLVSTVTRGATIMAGTTAPGVRNDATTGTAAAQNMPCWGNNATMTLAANRQACFWQPAGSNPTTYPTTPSTATNGVGQYGVLYNWCAAMGGQDAACRTDVSTQPNQSANDGTNIFNICPRGWRLPTGVPTTGEFTVLNNTINGGSTTSPAGLFTNGLFQYSGNFNSGNFTSQGTTGNGQFWSSSASSTTNSHNLNFSATFVVPANINPKGNGLAVRCVAD